MLVDVDCLQITFFDSTVKELFTESYPEEVWK